MTQPELATSARKNRSAGWTSLLIHVFCFLIFPLYIVYSGLEHLYLVKTSVQRQECLETMRKNLEQIEKYSNSSLYLHLLLKRIFIDTQASADPVAHLQRSIDKLKREYPNDFEFIVWNAQGKIIQSLTDRKGFSYVLAKLYTVLGEVAVSMKIDRQTNIKELPLVKSNLNLIRKYLGKIFMPNHLSRPYLAGQQAGPLLADFGGRFNSVWYQMGDRLSFLCFLSDRLLHQYDGLNKIVAVLNRQNPDFVNGFTLSSDIANPATEVPSQFLPILTRALAEFENLSESLFENDRLLIKLDLAQPGIRSFSLLEKKPEEWSRAILVNQRFIRIAFMLLLFHLLLHFHLNYRVSFISIRWKLTCLFLLANLAPITILAFIAQDYLSNMTLSLRTEVQSDLLRQIRDFDMRYSRIKSDISGKFNSFFDQINQIDHQYRFTKERLGEIKSFLKQFSPAEAYLIDSSGNLLIKEQAVIRDNQQGFGFVAQLGDAILKFNNGILLSRSKNDIFSALLSPDNAEFIRDSYRLEGKITSISLGNTTKIGYWYMFGDKKTYQNSHILLVVWNADRFQEHYIEQYFEYAGKNKLQAEFMVQRADAGKSWPKQSVLPVAMLSEFTRASGFQDSHVGSFLNHGQSYIFACARGRNLDQMILAYISPESTIKKRVSSIRLSMVVGAFISLLLSIIIGQALSAQFLIPIHRLGEGAMAIGAHRFKHRIPAGDDDEFGYLSTVFNRVIEGLGELEVARIVQENLFPGNNFKAGVFTIYGKSVVMTTLGGDYYDCLKINSNNWGVVIGDVAGHGVPAGLMMAMAKAGVLMASDTEKLDPAALVMRLHQIFFAIKNEKLKRMMTLQYFVFNPQNGDFSFANAGHCFPVIVRPQCQIAEYIEQVATPLGIRRKAKYRNFAFNVAEGEALVLYTDGIAEANNAEGEAFGFERLRSLLVTTYDPDPALYYQRIFAAYNDWTRTADDDLTLIIINRNNENSN